MTPPTVLVLGAGVAGPALAYWLARHGMRPTVVEQAAELRSGGTAVVVKDRAHAVVEEMGVLPRLRELATTVDAMALLDANGRRIARIPTSSDRSPSVEVTRADLSAVLRHAVGDDAEFLFDETVTALEQDGEGVDVTFRRAAPRRFDLVVGADGVHSAIRGLVFGPERDFVTDLPLYAASVPVSPDLVDDPREMLLLNAPGRMLAIHPSRTTPVALFTFRGPRVDGYDGYDRHDTALQKRMLAAAYAPLGWRVPELVATYQEHPAPFFQPLGNLRLPTWSRGRVALVGDAASAVALLSDGSSLAIAGAHGLAAALAAHPGDHAGAFRAYEADHRPRADAKHRLTGVAAALLVPRTRAGLAVRNTLARTVTRATRTPLHDPSATRT